MLDVIEFLRIIIVSSILIIGSYTDIKTRRVPDKVWIAATPIGLILLIIQMLKENYDLSSYIVFIPIGVLIAEEFIDREPLWEGGRYNLPWLGAFFIGAFSFLLLIIFGVPIELIQIPVIMALIFIFFYMGMIHGGADAKAFITIAIIIPFYPSLINPLFEMQDVMQNIFPFTLSLLINSIFVFIFVPVVLFILNTAKGNLQFPLCFFGYKKSLNSIIEKVWLMEYFEDDKLKKTIFPKDVENMEEQVSKLKESGKDDVWVTPKVPFIVPMAAAFFFTLFIGNIIHIILFRHL